MKQNIYQYKNYKKFLQDYIASRPYAGRGVKSKIAEYLSMHTAYVSQVMRGDAHFTVEQAHKLTSFLELTKNETHYFILLVQKERAGSKDLEKYYLDLMDEFRRSQESLKNRLEVEGEINQEDRQTYYSSWQYIAIHALLSTNQFNSPMAIAQRLALPIEKVNEVIEFLIKTGVVEKMANSYKLNSRDLHLSKESPMISTHHTNWRMQSINSLSRVDSDELHYSGVISVKLEDAKAIQNILVKSLQDVRGVIKDSKPEEIYCYTIDFFKV